MDRFARCVPHPLHGLPQHPSECLPLEDYDSGYESEDDDNDVCFPTIGFHGYNNELNVHNCRDFLATWTPFPSISLFADVPRFIRRDVQCQKLKPASPLGPDNEDDLRLQGHDQENRIPAASSPASIRTECGGDYSSSFLASSLESLPTTQPDQLNQQRRACASPSSETTPRDHRPESEDFGITTPSHEPCGLCKKIEQEKAALRNLEQTMTASHPKRICHGKFPDLPRNEDSCPCRGVTKTVEEKKTGEQNTNVKPAKGVGK